MPDLPVARASRLLVEELAGELLVYDQDTDTAHVLNDDVARVWQLCDGSADVQRIANDLALDAAVVRHALDELESCALLASAGHAPKGLSRRETFKKAAKIGAAAASAPLIYSLAIAPSAAMATPVACAAVTCTSTGDCRNSGAQAAGCGSHSTCDGTGHCFFVL